MKNVFIIYSLIILLTAYPASAADASLTRWVLNVTLNDDGSVEEVIQAEIENSGSSPLDGFSFVVPASGVTMLYDFEHTASFTGLVVEQQTAPGGTRLIVNFNSSVGAGKKWDGRIGFKAEKWAIKEGLNYSIDIPIEAPKAIVSGKSTDLALTQDAEIRAQVFLPKSVEVISVKPKPFRILFQFNHMVPTYSPNELHIGDTISINGSFSNVLNKIVEANEKLEELSKLIKEAKAQGRDVSGAEAHLKNAQDYNTNQALASFWKKEDSVALQYAGYANEELKQAENSLSTAGTANPTATATATAAATVSVGKKTPGFEASILVFILLVTFLLKRKK